MSRSRAQLMVVGNAIVIASRKHRSKWWTLTCGCPQSRRRKDGSCKHQRMVLDAMRPDVKARTRLDPVQMAAREDAQLAAGSFSTTSRITHE